MKTKTIVRVFAILLAIMRMSSLLVACVDKNKKPNGGGGDDGDVKKGYDSETVPLVMSTQELDGVFNPFYSTSGREKCGFTKFFHRFPDSNLVEIDAPSECMHCHSFAIVINYYSIKCCAVFKRRIADEQNTIRQDYFRAQFFTVLKKSLSNGFVASRQFNCFQRSTPFESIKPHLNDIVRERKTFQ